MGWFFVVSIATISGMSWFKGTTLAGFFSALFVGVFTFTASEHLFYGTVNSKYFFLVIFTSLLGCWFSFKVSTGQHVFSFRGRWLLLLGALTLAASYVSGILGIFPERSFLGELLRSTGLVYVSYVGALAFFLSELLNERDWTLVRRVVAVSAALYAFLTLLGAQGFDIPGKFFTVNLENTGITFGSETFGGVYLLIAFVLTLIEFFRSKSVRQYVLFGGLLFVQFLSPLLFNTAGLLSDVSGSLSQPLTLVGTARSSSVAVVVLLMYLTGVLIINRWGSSRLKSYLFGVWGGLWVCALGLLIALLFTPASPVQGRYIQESTAARIMIWEAGFEAFKDRPLLGWGPENFRLAFDQHFDNRLYLDENIGEIWFDRAHNIFIDTLVSVGLLGTLFHALLAFYAIVVAIRASRAGIISSLEGHVLSAFPIVHLLQLQTGFDTVGTYAFAGVVFAYLLWLERQMSFSALTISPSTRKLGASVLVVLIVAVAIPALFNEYRQQKSLYKIFVTPNAAQQEVYIQQALAQQSDFEAFRLAYSSLIKGLFSQIAEKKLDQRQLTAGMRQLGIYEAFLRQYVAEHPEDYRTRLNFVYLLLTTTALGGDNHIAEAKEVIAGSYKLSPENPLTYVLAATAEMYGGNIVGAREKIAEGIALNPDIEFTQNMAQYIEKQAAQFPNITVLKLENL